VSRERVIAWFLFGLSLAASLPVGAATLSATPASLTFTYQLGAATGLPTAQSLAVKTSGSTSQSFTVATPSADEWLTVTPSKAATPATLKVYVNPTTLTAGSYTSSITLSPPGSTVLTVTVTLTVKAPAPVLQVTPTSVAQTLPSGADPVTATINLSSTGSPLAFAVAPSGGSWLAVTPVSGLALASPPVGLKATLIAADLAPGSYKGTINITSGATGAKPIAVAVSLTVTAATPFVTSVWPARVNTGAGATTVTIMGAGFYVKSVAKAGSTALKTTILSPNVLQATIPAELLTDAGDLLITVANPGIGDSAPLTFTVQMPKPTFSANGVVNGASFLAGAVAPGEIVTIFGSGLGPAGLTSAVPDASGVIGGTLNGVTVTFDDQGAPMLYVDEQQLAVVAPYQLDGKSTTKIVIDNNGTKSDEVSVPVAAASPGIFTGAVFNVDPTTGAWTLNTDKNAAVRGNWITLFATGGGQLEPPGENGKVIMEPIPTVKLPASASIGGVDVPENLVAAFPAPGFISGLLQVNVQVPNSATGNAIPLVLRFGTGAAMVFSPPVTMAVK
jgi:uncharacterized protein (TIGR03437 family)